MTRRPARRRRLPPRHSFGFLRQSSILGVRAGRRSTSCSMTLVKMVNVQKREFRRNLAEAIRHGQRRAMARWKSLTILPNIFANQRDRCARRGAGRAQTQKFTFFTFFFEITSYLGNLAVVQ